MIIYLSVVAGNQSDDQRKPRDRGRPMVCLV